MTKSVQDTMDGVGAYTAPTITDLGSLAEVTAGGSGAAMDSCNTGAFTYSTPLAGPAAK